MSQILVLLHGWGLNRSVWDAITPRLSAHFRVEALNIPGFGGAPWDPQRGAIEHVADQLATDIEAFGQPVVLLGWSLGGLLATLIASRHPQLVCRLHTVASSPCFVAAPETHWPGIEREVLQAFQGQLEQDFNATLKRFLAVQALGSPSARQDVKAMQHAVLSQPPANPDALAAGLNWLAQTDLRNTLPQLSVPLYRSYGRLDTLVPRAVADAVTPGQSTIFEHSAHAPFLNQPEAFCTWLSNN